MELLNTLWGYVYRPARWLCQALWAVVVLLWQVLVALWPLFVMMLGLVFSLVLIVLSLPTEPKRPRY
jgi:hypothetical protein